MQIAIEHELCQEYLLKSEDEQPLISGLADLSLSSTIIVAQGFEERTLGVLTFLAKAGAKVGSIIIGRYETDHVFDDTNSKELEELAEKVAPKRWQVVANHNDGLWIQDAVMGAPGNVLVDITGVSHRAMFPVLDILERSEQAAYIAYTEAKHYWPRYRDWQMLSKQLDVHESLGELVDKQPWLFSYEHHVELVTGHEGYDAGGGGRALIAFLPYKCSRLAAILATEDYGEKIFIAGKPPLSELGWRVDALKKINESLTRGSLTVEISTFGYRCTLSEMAGLLFCDDSLLWKYDIHLAALGSKLQTVGCWALSKIVPSITAITSVPKEYFRAAFSEGVGESWIFRLARISK